ncbi:MAG: ArsR/SmtB family transcription factor [Bacteroidia bacterium]|nr:winged helix-turn-helix transcriptional regulator [Bacteroidota bacterium]
MRKKEHDLVLISESLKAMAHPDRISILTLLGQKKEIKFSVSQICDQLKLNQPEVSRHLSILKNKGILMFERVGSHIYYSLNKNNLVFNCIEKLLHKK